MAVSKKKKTEEVEEAVSPTAWLVEDEVSDAVSLEVAEEMLAKEVLKTSTILSTFDVTHIKVLEACIKDDRPSLLIGHTGLGKTTLVSELAKQHGKELVRISVHSGVTTDEILGKWLAENGSTVWQDGILTEALKKGKWVVFDEINACPADVMFALHSLLDDARYVTLLEKNGEVVRPAEGFRLFATMNPPDDYAGTKEMNMAFMSRFGACLWIHPYPSDVEIKILESHGIDIGYASGLVAYARVLREKQEKGEILFFCGTRDLINVGKLMMDGIDADPSWEYAVINKMNSDDAKEARKALSITAKKSKEQARIEELEARCNAYIDELKKKQDEVNKALDKIAQHAQTIGGVNLDEKTKKALQILGVITK